MSSRSPDVKLLVLVDECGKYFQLTFDNIGPYSDLPYTIISRIMRSCNALPQTQVTKDTDSPSDRPNKVSDSLLYIYIIYIDSDQCDAMAANNDPGQAPLTPLEQMIKNLSNKFDTFQNNIKTIDDNIRGLIKEVKENQANTNNRLDDLTKQNKLLENKLKSATERIETLENLLL